MSSTAAAPTASGRAKGFRSKAHEEQFQAMQAGRQAQRQTAAQMAAELPRVKSKYSKTKRQLKRVQRALGARTKKRRATSSSSESESSSASSSGSSSESDSEPERRKRSRREPSERATMKKRVAREVQKVLERMAEQEEASGARAVASGYSAATTSSSAARSRPSAQPEAYDDMDAEEMLAAPVATQRAGARVRLPPPDEPGLPREPVQIERGAPRLSDADARPDGEDEQIDDPFEDDGDGGDDGGRLAADEAARQAEARAALGAFPPQGKPTGSFTETVTGPDGRPVKQTTSALKLMQQRRGLSVPTHTLSRGAQHSPFVPEYMRILTNGQL
jgi:hypothetical protein